MFDHFGPGCLTCQSIVSALSSDVFRSQKDPASLCSKSLSSCWVCTCGCTHYKRSRFRALLVFLIHYCRPTHTQFLFLLSPQCSFYLLRYHLGIFRRSVARLEDCRRPRGLPQSYIRRPTLLLLLLQGTFEFVRLVWNLLLRREDLQCEDPPPKENQPSQFRLCFLRCPSQ